ncbi:MAG: hypothetical protein ABI295_01215 [Xanthomarina sp.]
MQLEKLFYKYKFKIKRLIFGKKKQHVRSNRITIRNNKAIILNFDSDLDHVFQCLNYYGISVKKNTVTEIEQEIEKKILENMSYTLSNHSDSAEVSRIVESFLEKTDNKNLLFLKHHVLSLKHWIED